MENPVQTVVRRKYAIIIKKFAFFAVVFVFVFPLLLVLALFAAWPSPSPRDRPRNFAELPPVEPLPSYREFSIGACTAPRGIQQDKPTASISLAGQIHANFLYPVTGINLPTSQPDQPRLITYGNALNPARIWDAVAGRASATLDGDNHRGGFDNRQFSQDGSRVAMEGGMPYQPTIRVFDTQTGHVAATFAPGRFTLRSLVLNRDGTRAAAGGDAHSFFDSGARMFVWDVDTGREIEPLPEEFLKNDGEEGSILDHASLSADGRRLATMTGFFYPTLSIWNLADNRLLFRRKSASQWDSAIAAFSMNGNRLVLRNREGTVAVIDLASDAPPRPILGLKASNTYVSPDGIHAVTIGPDQGEVWDLSAGSVIARLEAWRRLEPVKDTTWAWRDRAAFSEDGARVAVRGNGNVVRVWDIASGRLLGSAGGATRWIRRAVVSGDGTRIVTMDQMTKASVLRAVPSGRLIAALPRPVDERLRVAFSPDSSRFVAIDRNGTVTIRASSDGRALQTLAVESGQTVHALFSPDGTRVVTLDATMDGRIWDTASGHEIAHVPGSPANRSPPYDGLQQGDWTAFSPDGSKIATLDDDKTRLWDVASGALLREIEARAVIASFRPDGAQLALAVPHDSYDGGGYDIQQWDIATGIKTDLTLGTEHRTAFLHYSPNGQQIMFGDGGETIRVWNIRDATRWKMPRSSSAGSMIGGGGWAKDGTPLALTCDPSGR